MHELPLLIFTLCLQGSVGVTVWLALGRQYAVEDACLHAARFRDGGGVCTGLRGAACFSAAHGLSLNALNALRHVASSWLSREIVFASLYLAALGLGIVLLFSESGLAAAAGAGGSVWAGGCILHGAGLYPCLGGDGSIATRWRCSLARQALSAR